MKTQKILSIIGLLLLSGGAPLKSETRQERAARIIAAADANYTPKGIVVQPTGDTADGQSTVILRAELVRNAAKILAKVTQKEVFVSAKVEMRRFSLDQVSGTRDEVATALIDALAGIDVVVVNVGDAALALIEKGETQEPK